MNIDFARGLDLPADAVTQTLALIGRKGGGKTYTAGKLVEGMVNIGAQVIVVDPVGVYWGLRLGANGKGKGLDIPILGGERGDIPLTEESGGVVGEFIVSNRRSMILDISLFRKAARVRFVTALAEQIFHLKKTSRTPVHIVLEEAHKFIPQRLQRGEEAMVGAWEDIVRLGRNYGIGVTMISQRPQSINKEVLNQTECLICHQITGPHERKAIKEWVVDRDLNIGNMVDDLPYLNPGEAYLWSPAWLNLLKKICVKKKRTYDASSTPEVGVEYNAESRPLGQIEVKNLTSAMESAVHAANAKDPKVLRKRVKELESKLDDAQSSMDDVDESVLAKMVLDQVERLVDEAVRAAVEKRDSDWRESIEVYTQTVKGASHKSPPEFKLAYRQPNTAMVPTNGRVRPHTRSQSARKHVTPHRGTGRDTGDLTGPQQRIIDAIAWWNGMGIPMPIMGQIAFRAGYTPKGGSFNTYVSQLSTSGLILRAFGAAGLTIEGKTQASTPDINGGLDGLHSAIIGAIQNGKGTGGPHAKILAIVIDLGGDGEISTHDLADEAGYAVGGGSFNTYVSKLSSLGLIVRRSGMVSPSEILYPVSV